MIRTYFDAATAAPLHPAARQAYAAAMEGWADPARLYSEARQAAQLVDAARAVVAEVLDIAPEGVFFTPSGTAAAHMAILGTATARPHHGASVIHSAVEHSAVIQAAEHLGSARSVPVSPTGVVDVPHFIQALRSPDVVLAALMSANHEVGTVQPIVDVAAACESANVPLYVDASVSLGHMDIAPVWSLLTGSARKWGGPTGVGVLAVKPHVRWRSPWPGDAVETGLNIPSIVAAAAALRAVHADKEQRSARLHALINRIRAQVPTLLNDVEVVGEPHERAPHIVTFSCLYVDGESLVHELNKRGFAVSSGSACVASTLEPSHVLAAMGALTHGNLRISLHEGNTAEDVERFLAVLPEVVHAQRGAV
ncbi:MAG: aminotransferase class V-fold PLP-dependent enzyme [Corynebacteriales bacterium]|nr:aminotransferase class V-fold PLP-dependent enzyme [Mycobacteriales bacterium]